MTDPVIELANKKVAVADAMNCVKTLGIIHATMDDAGDFLEALKFRGFDVVRIKQEG